MIARELFDLSRPSMPLSSRTLAVLCALAVSLNLAFLLGMAKYANFWDDEVFTYFFTGLPYEELIVELAGNISEDPPEYYFVLKPWRDLVGPSPFLLRLLPIALWALAVLGFGLAASELTSVRGGIAVVIVLSLMPLHWTYPASFRWYSLNSANLGFNTFFFFRMISRIRDNPGASDRGLLGRNIFPREGYLNIAGYTVTGVSLWYINYIAPVYFFTHLLAAWFFCGRLLLPIRNFIIGWVLILLLYAPWIPVFLRQLSKSLWSQNKGLGGYETLPSLFVLTAGEISSPFAWETTIPLAIGLGLAGFITLKVRGNSLVPAIMVIVLFLLMLMAGVVNSRRMILLSPLMGLWVGMLIHSASLYRGGIRMMRLGVIFVFMVFVTGSSGHFFDKKNWLSYR